jgi:hypothetical protein
MLVLSIYCLHQWKCCKFKLELKQICNSNGMKAIQIASHNSHPQANAIIEQIHKVVNDMLRSCDLEKENLDEYSPLDYFYQSTGWEIHISNTYHITLKAIPMICFMIFLKHLST